MTWPVRTPRPRRPISCGAPWRCESGPKSSRLPRSSTANRLRGELEETRLEFFFGARMKPTSLRKDPCPAADALGEDSTAADRRPSTSEECVADRSESSSKPVASSPRAMRILAVTTQWYGSNAAAYVSAFRRLGHSVLVVPQEEYVPTLWRRKSLRAGRRLAEGIFVAEF